MIDYVAADFDVHLISTETNSGGVDRAAQNILGRTATAAYAIKWSAGGTGAGLVVPSALADQGVRAVAAPVRTRDGRLWSERDGRRLSVVPWVGDRQGLDGGLDEQQWREFGAVLAATHALPVTPELAAVLPVAGHEQDLASIRATEALLQASPPADDIAAATRHIWMDHAQRIAAAVDRVESLAPAVTPSTVCHTDPHLGNVLATAGRMWLIDWDDAALSTPEHDLMFVLGGTYGAEHIGDQEREWFFEGYGPVTVDPARLAYWRASRGLADIAFLAGEAFTPGDYGDTWRAKAVRLLAANLRPDGLIAMAMDSFDGRPSTRTP
ncbi:phosphotransferase enzyme family protein [Actinoplanes flavus]|uniref:Aminoglycoside phosphotransferase family protein n=1 Tax=Actinoplanes flavus TaxID=2820290 RepID=A0ABS3V0K5_9ACTN|nr:aminoglycoside phosphotransferase family protein [Actinoplanes flavus]MBO3744365.1 aminoglycoside phosphotransferase family protein [Actinoplanes flavus]